MMLLVGSRAMNYWYGYIREPIDWDIICTYDDLLRWRKVAGDNIQSLMPWKNNSNKFHAKTDRGKIEFEVATPGSSGMAFLEIYHNYDPEGYIPYDAYGHVVPADPSTLCLIKKSHLHIPIRWWKHINDYHVMKNPDKCNVPPNYIEPSEAELAAYRLRVAEIDARWEKGKTNLAMSNAQFFAKSESQIGRTYIHDDIHKVMAFGESPIYKLMKDDQSKAAVSKKKFFALDDSTQIKAVQEEALVIALERKIIPAIEIGLQYNADAAYKYAIRRICTTLTSGWFRDFAIEHIPSIMEYPTNYVTKFIDAVTNNLITRRISHV